MANLRDLCLSAGAAEHGLCPHCCEVCSWQSSWLIHGQGEAPLGGGQPHPCLASGTRQSPAAGAVSEGQFLMEPQSRVQAPCVNLASGGVRHPNYDGCQRTPA